MGVGRRSRAAPALPAGLRVALALGCCRWHGAGAEEEEEDDYFVRCSHLEHLRQWRAPWPGGCLVRTPGGDHSAKRCREACERNVYCSLWQYTDGGQCMLSANSCRDGGGDDPDAAVSGGLVQHGTAGAYAELPADVEVAGLLSLGLLPDPDGGGAAEDGGASGLPDREQAELCRSVCYADIGCGYWQYGDGGCRVERRPDFVASFDANQTSPANLSLVGEQVARGCPHDPHPISLGVGVACAALGSLALAWAACAGGRNAVTREGLLKAREASASSSRGSWSRLSDEDEARRAATSASPRLPEDDSVE